MLAEPNTPQSLPPEADPVPATAPAAPPAADGTPQAEFTIRPSRQGPLNVLRMAGALYAPTVVTAEAQILSAIVLSERPLHLVLDMTEVTRVDSSGVSLLAKTRFAVHAARGDLHVVAPSGCPAQRAFAASVLSSALNRVERVDAVRV